MTAKVALAGAVRGDFGLQPALAALGLARSTWHYRRTPGTPYAEKHGHLRRPLEGIARAHPEYGYRRTTTELRARLGVPVNHKVVQRLHHAWDLPLQRRVRPPRPSGIRQALQAAGAHANLVAPLEAIAVLAVLYTDFTASPYGGGTATFLPLLDHASKVVLGWAVGPRGDTALALDGWRGATRMLARLGRSAAGLIVHHDRDGVFTGHGWTHALLVGARARLSYALHGARDNPEMESFCGRFKTENASLFHDAPDLAALAAVIAQRLHYYNHHRRHSAVGNVPPWEYLQARL